jgi:hypothetical protein
MEVSGNLSEDRVQIGSRGATGSTKTPVQQRIAL